MDLVDHVYVINLDREVQRWESMLKQQPILGKPFTRVSAVDGKRLSPQDRLRYATPLCAEMCTDTMIAVFLSHRKCWQAALDNRDRFAVVLEDDCELRKDALDVADAALKELANIDPTWDILFLGNSGFTRRHDPKRHLGQHLYIPWMLVGAHGYVINRRSAEKLLRLLDKASYHVDVVLYTTPQVVFYGTREHVAHQSSSTTQSSQIASRFPVSLNAIFDRIHENNGVPFSYGLSSPLFQVLRIPVIPYILILWFALAFVPAGSAGAIAKFVTAWFAFEAVMNRSDWYRIAVYAAIALGILRAKTQFK